MLHSHPTNLPDKTLQLAYESLAHYEKVHAVESANASRDPAHAELVKLATRPSKSLLTGAGVSLEEIATVTVEQARSLFERCMSRIFHDQDNREYEKRDTHAQLQLHDVVVFNHHDETKLKRVRTADALHLNELVPFSAVGTKVLSHSDISAFIQKLDENVACFGKLAAAVIAAGALLNEAMARHDEKMTEDVSVRIAQGFSLFNDEINASFSKAFVTEKLQGLAKEIKSLDLSEVPVNSLRSMQGLSRGVEIYCIEQVLHANIMTHTFVVYHAPMSDETELINPNSEQLKLLVGLAQKLRHAAHSLVYEQARLAVESFKRFIPAVSRKLEYLILKEPDHVEVTNLFNVLKRSQEQLSQLRQIQDHINNSEDDLLRLLRTLAV